MEKMKKILKITALVLVIACGSLALSTVITITSINYLMNRGPHGPSDESKVRDHFERLDKLGFSDNIADYDIIKDKGSLALKLKTNDIVIHSVKYYDTVSDKETLQNHIYSHYYHYLTTDYLQHAEGSSFSKIEQVLKDKGVQWEFINPRYGDDQIGYSKTKLLKTKKLITDSDVTDYFKGKSRKGFDYIAYMDYFQYTPELAITVKNDVMSKDEVQKLFDQANVPRVRFVVEK